MMPEQASPLSAKRCQISAASVHLRDRYRTSAFSYSAINASSLLATASVRRPRTSKILMPLLLPLTTTLSTSRNRKVSRAASSTVDSVAENLHPVGLGGALHAAA